jgi:alanine-glyoxylate transaminase / serine-glyoxylate transaminase / serine-pyruvate transaminase
MDPTFPPLPNPGRILLGPGPSMADPRVLQAMSGPLIGHLDPQFLQLMAQVQELLRRVFETRNELSLAVPGTGTAAMETAVAALVEAGTPVLVCRKGYFGNRIAEMAQVYGADLTILDRPMGQVFQPDEIREALKKKPARVVAIVQAETSTGVLQPIKEVAEIVHAQGGILLVDAVTSLGGVPVSVEENGIDVCYSCSQKCLGCAPGASPITFNDRALEFIRRRETPIGSWYLDINRLAKYWGPEHVYHHTASSPLLYGLAEGLRIVVEEGLQARFDRHLRNARLLWEGLESLGFSLFVPEEYRLPTLTTVRIPEGLEDLAFRKQLLERHNIEISGAMGELRGKVWRIGLMGYSSNPANIQLLLEAFKTM